MNNIGLEFHVGFVIKRLGVTMVRVSAAALASENKILAHPASVGSIPTSADKEDHVPMGSFAARKRREIVRNVEHIPGGFHWN
jgi:histidine ammonia-lyase